MVYLSNLRIENFRCFGDGEQSFELELRPGVTALVGENDSGKTAVIDALRFSLGTSDQEWYRVEDADFHMGDASRQVKVILRFEDLDEADRRAFLEYLTYAPEEPDKPVVYVNWTVKDIGEMRRGRPFRRVEVCSGRNGDGPTLAPEARDLLRATYLRPLRDAEEALSAGRRSRLSDVLYQTPEVRKGEPYNWEAEIDLEKLTKLSLAGIADLANHLLAEQGGIKEARKAIKGHLSRLQLSGDDSNTRIHVGGADMPDDGKVRQLLEKLDLTLERQGKSGLGSDNLLFIACELLLLTQADDGGNKMLLIEEPEAHLHPQRQLRVMKYLQERATEDRVQVIITTHSPNLASAIDLDNMVMIRPGRAYPLRRGETNLAHSDYRFLQRFLDVTKANLFFARGVMIVEGDAESILLPTLASLLGRDFTEHGVSIVNVGGVGLRRYARIFQRRDPGATGQLDIRVACLTDMDVMPDCAPRIIGRVGEGGELLAREDRRWLVKGDFGDGGLDERREKLRGRASGQWVKTFVSDEWTLEYDLALGPRDEDGAFGDGLAKDVFVAACLADNDDNISDGNTTIEDEEQKALDLWAREPWRSGVSGRTTEEARASFVYARFAKRQASKAVAAQYLAERLKQKIDGGKLTREQLRGRLPHYLTAAVDYVTAAEGDEANPATEGER